MKYVKKGTMNIPLKKVIGECVEFQWGVYLCYNERKYYLGNGHFINPSSCQFE